jgi:thiamine biosynthesis protein ThiS
MQIRLNGESYEIAGPLTVLALLEHLGIDHRRVAVEHNTIVVRRQAYDSTIVKEHDEVEIVNFVGGGGGCDKEKEGRRKKEEAPRASKHSSFILPSFFFLLTSFAFRHPRSPIPVA